MKFLLVFLPWIVILDTCSTCAKRYTLRYSELEKLGASCSPEDTCSKHRLMAIDNLSMYRCQCGSDCVKFNTCCIDSRYVYFMPIYWGRKRGTCQAIFSSDETALVVSQCHERWRGNPDVKSLCEEISYSLKDPIGMTPVTNLRSEVTYRNYFCALCNHDAGDLEGWRSQISVYGSQNPTFNNGLSERDIWERLRINEYDQWGIDQLNEFNQTEFRLADIKFVIQPWLRSLVIPCIPNLVSDCPVGWTNEEVRFKCLSYMGIVYLTSNLSGTQIPYRNIHCAICNNVEFSADIVCERSIYEPASAGKPAMSFTLLLDVNLADGDKVGEIDRCGKGKMYDPFFKKCRALVCGLPNYVVKDGNCVKT